MSYQCNFCYTIYSTKGGCTRHLHFCKEKRRSEKRQHFLELEKVRENAKPTIINNYITININVMTQKRIESESVFFEGFSEKLMCEIGKVRWDSAENAMLQLCNIKQKIQTSTDEDKKICEWLESDEIEREEVDEVDNEALLVNTVAKVDEIEGEVIKAITTGMSKNEGEKFKELVLNGIFA